MTTRLLRIAELVVWDPAIAGTRTLRYSNIGYATRPSEAPASAHYDARLKASPGVIRFAFGRGRISGPSEIAFEDLVLRNSDGALDALDAYAFNGRSIVIREADIPASGVIPAYPAGFTTVFNGTMLSGYPTSGEFIVKTKGLEAQLNLPVQTTKYAGSNVLPDGLEGVESDLVGRPKPLLFGRARNIAPPCVNTSKLIYQINDGAIDDVEVVRDSGVILGAPTSWSQASPMGTTFTGTSAWVWYSEDLDQFLAVGVTGGLPELGTSTDNGRTWTLQTHSFGGNILAGAWGGPSGNRLWVVVGSGGQIRTSPDGVTWTIRASGVIQPLTSVTWSDSAQLWVIVGGSGRMLTSPDGVTWTAQTSSFGATDIAVVVAGTDIIIAAAGNGVGVTGKVAWSVDGVTWTQGFSSTGTNFAADWRAGAFANDEFRIVGTGGLILRSKDGKTWGRMENPFDGSAGGTAFDLNSISFGNGVWLVGGATTDIIYTYNALWTRAAIGITSAGATSVAFGTACFVAAMAAQGIGVTLHGEAYASLADLEDDSLAPAAGNWKVYLAGGYIRLGSPPSGLITCDATQGATAADRTTGQIWGRLLTRAGKVSGVDYSAADIIALDLAASAPVGIWINDEVSYGELLDQVTDAKGCWWAPDRTGMYRIQQLTLPSGANVAEYVRAEIKGRLERSSPSDVPTYRVIVDCDRNYSVQTDGVAGGVPTATRAVLAQEWRKGAYTDASIQTANLLARQFEKFTLLTSVTDAIAEATRLQALNGARRDWYPIKVENTPANRVIDLGNVVKLTHSRFGLAAGKQFRVLGIEPGDTRTDIVLHLWGGV